MDKPLRTVHYLKMQDRSWREIKGVAGYLNMSIGDYLETAHYLYVETLKKQQGQKLPWE